MIGRRLKLSYLTLLFIGIGAAILVWQQQAVLDWWRLRGYQPSQNIAALASDTAMTDAARRVFYVNHPELISDGEKFRDNCPIIEETIILGCYHSGQSGIHIYDVSDSRLDGIEQVTAAHEMLHAYYERLDGEDKENINRLLLNFYRSGDISDRVKRTVALYEKSDPQSVVNEIHSIFGTEIVDLPSELESYYGRYFSDRQQVVGYSLRYEAEFESRSSQIRSMDEQLAGLKVEIDNQEADLSSQLRAIESLRSRLDIFRESGDFAAYNALVDSYNNQITVYNDGVKELKSNIDRYNQLVAERNALAVELKGLEQAIDTRLTNEAP